MGYISVLLTLCPDVGKFAFIHIQLNRNSFVISHSLNFTTQGKMKHIPGFSFTEIILASLSSVKHNLMIILAAKEKGDFFFFFPNVF